MVLTHYACKKEDEVHFEVAAQVFRKITAVRGNETCSIFGPIPQFQNTINFLHLGFCVWPGGFGSDCAFPYR